jgi:hypothetical protein
MPESEIEWRISVNRERELMPIDEVDWRRGGLLCVGKVS